MTAPHRPSVDVLFESAARLTAPALGVVLTGMGDDGLAGGRQVRAAGARSWPNPRERHRLRDAPRGLGGRRRHRAAFDRHHGRGGATQVVMSDEDATHPGGIADNFEAAQAGALVYVDERGRVIAARERSPLRAGAVRLAGRPARRDELALLVDGGPIGLAVGGTLTLLVLRQATMARGLERAMTLLATEQLDEAEAELQRLLRRALLPRRLRTRAGAPLAGSRRCAVTTRGRWPCKIGAPPRPGRGQQGERAANARIQPRRHPGEPGSRQATHGARSRRFPRPWRGTTCVSCARTPSSTSPSRKGVPTTSTSRRCASGPKRRCRWPPPARCWACSPGRSARWGAATNRGSCWPWPARAPARRWWRGSIPSWPTGWPRSRPSRCDKTVRRVPWRRN